jgi:hypothetical protein
MMPPREPQLQSQSIFEPTSQYQYASLFYAPIDGERSAADGAAWGTTPLPFLTEESLSVNFGKLERE